MKLWILAICLLCSSLKGNDDIATYSLMKADQSLEMYHDQPCNHYNVQRAYYWGRYEAYMDVSYFIYLLQNKEEECTSQW